MDIDFSKLSKGAYGNNVNVRKSDNMGSAVLYNGNGLLGVLTGNYTLKPDGRWYQILPVAGYLYGYVREDVIQIKELPSKSRDEAQRVINQIINQDKDTLTSLLICSEYCKRLRAKGYNVEKQRKEIKQIYLELYDRNQSLANSVTLSGKEAGRSTLKDFAPALTNIVNDNSLGFVLTTSIILTIVITAVVGAAVGGTVVYYQYKNQADRANANFKACKTLEDVLSKVSPEVRKIILDDCDRQVKGAYNDGAWSNLFSGSSSLIKYSLIGLGVYFIYKTFKE